MSTCKSLKSIDDDLLVIHCGPWAERIGKISVFSGVQTDIQTSDQKTIFEALTKGDLIRIISKESANDYWISISDQTSSDDGIINFWGTMKSKCNGDGLAGDTVQFQAKHIQSILWLTPKVLLPIKSNPRAIIELESSADASRSEPSTKEVPPETAERESKTPRAAPAPQLPPRYGYHESRAETEGIPESLSGASSSPPSSPPKIVRDQQKKPIAFKIDTNPKTGRLPKRKKK